MSAVPAPTRFRDLVSRGRAASTGSFRYVSLVLLAFVSLLIAYPLGRAALRLLGVDEAGTSPIVEAYTQPTLPRILLHTALVVGGGVLLALVVGAALAWLNERTDARMGFATDVLPILPLLVPPIAGAIGWVILASPQAGLLNSFLRDLAGLAGIEMTTGPLNIFSWHGVLFVYALYLVPHVFLSVSAGLRNLDPSMEEASRVAGEGPWSTVVKVTLPAVRPSLISGALLASIYGVALFSVPAILGAQAGIDVLSVRIVRLMTFGFPPRTGVAIALGLVIIAVLMLGQWGQRRALRGGRHSTLTGKGLSASTVELGRWRGVARVAMLGYLATTTVLPFLGLVIVSLQPFWTANINLSTLNLNGYVRVLGQSGMLRSAFQNSFLLGLVGASVSVLVAAVIAYSVRTSGSRALSTATDYITKLPGAVSNIVIGIAFVIAFVGPPFNLGGTLLLLFLAYFVLYMPQATLTAGAAAGQIGSELLEASRLSGAGDGRTFRKVALPLMLPGMLSGWALVFVLTAGDITASVMLAGTRNPVVGFVILDLWGAGTFQTLAAISVLISLATSVIVLGTLTLGKRRERAWRGR